MKILLTGQPRTGKSTLLANILNVIDNKQGFITEEIRENNERLGFKLSSSNSNESVLAHTTIPTDYKVGRYFVNVNNLDIFIKPLFNFKSNQLLYIDEIGQIELLSHSFKELVDLYLNAENHFIGTITSIYSDEYIQKIKLLKTITIIELSLENREKIQEILKIIISRLNDLKKLSFPQQQIVEHLIQYYFNNKQYIQLKKLFLNAIVYVLEDRITKLNSNSYTVKGNTNVHYVNKDIDEWVCDCDLYNGKGVFINNKGECSHIQSVKLFLT